MRSWTGIAKWNGVVIDHGMAADDCLQTFDGNVGASDLLALLANWGPCQ